MATFPMWAAIRTVKSKLGTWVGYEKFREVDPGISREEWARAVGEARAAIANRTEELIRPLNRRPVGSEITLYTTRKARGYLQQIEVFVRDPDTGIVDSRPFVVKTDTLRSRQFIIDEGLSRYANAAATAPDDYPEEIIGAVYVGTHQLIPQG